METVFDHTLTPDEIEECGFLDSWLDVRHGLTFPDPLTEQGYRATITKEAAMFDLGLLYDVRGDVAKRDSYWDQVPQKAQEYKLGFDNQITED